MTNLLIVDDNPVDRLIIRTHLENHTDLCLIEASDGLAALDIMDATPVDLVLTDIRMPRVDGLNFLRRAKEQHIDIPIILMTARGSEEIAAKALFEGAVSYLPKTHLEECLTETIRKVVEAIQRRRKVRDLTRFADAIQTEYVLPSRCDWIAALVQELSDLAVRAGACSTEDRFRLGVAYEEALRNAVVHGNLAISSAIREQGTDAYEREILMRSQAKEYADRRVRVTAMLGWGEFGITIRDEGAGFDVQGLPDPTSPENLLKASGRGVLLMRAFMDEVSYNETGNEVTMIKRAKVDADDRATTDETQPVDAGLAEVW